MVPRKNKIAYRDRFSMFMLSPNGSTPKPVRFDLLNQNGDIIPAELNISSETIRGEWNAIGIVRDISDRLNAERRQTELMDDLEKVNTELKEFAYVISHDLKAPLRGIKTLATWIREDYAEKIDDAGKEQLDLLMSRTDRMHQLIEGVLQYSRVGRIREETQLIKTPPLVEDIIDLLNPPEHIKITYDEKMPSVTYEKTRLAQVFQNLLSNAVKYNDKENGVIHVSGHSANGFAEFCVQDNGPGIAKKDFQKIFQIFHTLQSKDSYESTGVGLTLVKKIVEFYGGEIRVESEQGSGSAFYFTVPLNEKNSGDPND